jgi:hypothetical protein
VNDRQSPNPDEQERGSSNSVPRAQSKQLLERHSLIRLANFVDDSPYPTDPQLPPPASIASMMARNEAMAPPPSFDPPQAQSPVQYQQQAQQAGLSSPTWSSAQGQAVPFPGAGAPMAMMEDSSFPGIFPIPSTAPANLGQWEGALQAPWDHLDFLINPNVYPQGAFEYFGAAGFE